MIVELKPEDRDLLRSTIDALRKVEVSKETSKSEKDTSKEPPEHQTIEEAVNCKDCYPKIRDLVLKKHREETKDSKLICKECGLGVKEEWESCPSCGSKEAKER